MYAGPLPDMEVDMSMKDSSSTNTVLPNESRTFLILLLSLAWMLSVHPQTVTPAPTARECQKMTSVSISHLNDHRPLKNKCQNNTHSEPEYWAYSSQSSQSHSPKNSQSVSPPPHSKSSHPPSHHPSARPYISHRAPCPHSEASRHTR